VRESDLYAPVKAYLQDHGFEVQAEVKDCDLVARKDEQLLIVELKKSINLTLLIQATTRQAITSNIYVAIPEIANRRSRQWRGTVSILRRLEIGLLVVTFGPLGSRVIRELDPPGGLEHSASVSKPNTRNTKKLKAIQQELDGRSASYNTGGVSQQQLMTAYRENTIFIACCLRRHGPLKTRVLRTIGTGDKTQKILGDNHYGWFNRVSRGIYCLNEKGAQALPAYPELCLLAENLLDQLDQHA
jgi:hypothetical protein